MSDRPRRDRDAIGAAAGGAARRIWLCADDYGISPAVNAAIRDLIARRRINATSVMVAAPSFQPAETAALVDAAATGAAIGLHVTLTAPFAPLSHGFQPLRHGAFLTLAATLRRSHIRSFKPELLTIEIVRQFEAFNAAFGRAPDFVDGHQHVQLFPQIREALLRVTKDAAPNAWVRQCGRMVAAHKRLADRKALLLDGLSRRFRRLAGDYGIPTNPAFAGTYTFRTRADYTRLFARFLDGMPDGGVVMCHPGVVDAELRRLDPLTDLREREYAFFSEDSFPRLLAVHGVTL
jgi:chitin disaccharide deacetylase